MPTGGGKSLCYQLPALVFEGTTIVVSPLIALMKDQVDALVAKGVAASFINSSLNPEELNERLSHAIAGDYKLLYIAPERLESDYFINLLKKINISFFAIDEAHCISEWGHDFRPAYLNISKAFDSLSIPVVAAFTATAGPEVQDDIISSLKLSKPVKFIKGFDRKNLSYRTIEAKDKIEHIKTILKSTKQGSTIIYCGSRKKAEEYTFVLNKLGFACETYHAGLEPQLRKTVQENFISDRTKIIAATNAFGMGIDKPDVRNVIHVDFTSTLEAYYQEAGRAGRDGKESACYLIFHSSDIELQEYFINSTYPEVAEMELLLATLEYYSDKMRQVKLSNTLLANYSSLPERKVETILDIFERNEIISRALTDVKAKIRFKCDRDSLINYYNSTSEQRKEVIVAVMRSLSSEVFKRVMDLDMVSLKRKFQLEDEAIADTMRALSFAGFVEFESEASAGSITLLFDKKPLSSLPFDAPSFEKRKQKARLKLAVVERYASTVQCKRNFILEYFQDDELEGTCGKCSSCLSSGKQASIKVKDDFLLKAVLNGLAQINNRFGKLVLNEFLRGVSSEKVRKYKLDQLSNYGILNDQSDFDVRNAINNAASKRYINVSAGLYPILSLSDIGISMISDKTLQTELSTDDTAKNEILNKLKHIRSEIAFREGLSDRSIASDKVLRSIADHPPSNLKELGSVASISRFVLEKYGKYLLSAIIEEVASEPEVFNDIKSDPIVFDFAKFIKDSISIDEIAKKTHYDKGSIARLIQQAIMNAEISLDWRLLTDEKTYYKIKTLIYKKPHITLRSLRETLNSDVDYAVLRILSAIARSED